MTQNPQPPQPPVQWAVLANVVGVALIAFGVAGVNVAGWTRSLGLGVTSLTVLAVGVLLAMREA